MINYGPPEMEQSGQENRSSFPQDLKINLKKTTEQDFPFFKRWIDEKENSKWFTSIYRLGKYNEITHLLTLKKKENYIFTIFDADKPIGLIGLYNIDLLDKSAMIWDVLGDKAYVRKGVMTTAMRLCIQEAFSTLGLHSIYGWLVEDNIPALRVAEKNNFKRIGIQRECHFMDGTFKNRILVDLTVDDVKDDIKIERRDK